MVELYPRTHNKFTCLEYLPCSAVLTDSENNNSNNNNNNSAAEEEEECDPKETDAISSTSTTLLSCAIVQRIRSCDVIYELLKHLIQFMGSSEAAAATAAPLVATTPDPQIVVASSEYHMISISYYTTTSILLHPLPPTILFASRHIHCSFADSIRCICTRVCYDTGSRALPIQ